MSTYVLRQTVPLTPMTLRWSDLAALYDVDVDTHYHRAEDAGLFAPPEVFAPLFHAHHDDADFASDLIHIDWTQVQWEAITLSGVAIRLQIAVPDGYDYTLDAARERALAHGLSDARAAVAAHWQSFHTWLTFPVILSGSLVKSLSRYQLRVGFTRVGTLLGLLDRRDIPEIAMHTFWLGTGLAR